MSEPKPRRPTFLQRLAVTATAPIVLVLVTVGHGDADTGFVAVALGAAVVCAAAAAALSRSWPSAVIGGFLAAVALVVLFFTLLYVACSTSGCE
jgi:hypothetical protein